MDFTFSPEADEAAELAAAIFAGACTSERLAAVEAGGDRYDHELWHSLADADLLALAIPEAYGGAGLGLVEASRVLVEAGRAVAPVPVASQVACVQLVMEACSAAQRDLWLFGAATGERRFGAAVAEPLESAPATPSVSAARSGTGWQLAGAKVLVRAAHHADALLVTASTPDGPAVFLVELPVEGVSVCAQRTSDGDVTGLVNFEAASAELLGNLDGTTHQRFLDLVTITACAELLGVTQGALARTAEYARTREQFGRPIGMFQAVRHRLADGHIDVLAQRLTLWQAVWRLSEGVPAAAEVATAALWAADAAHRIAHTTVHVHGGVGIDLDGSAHRYFTAAKRWEMTLGSATSQALAIGASFARAN